MILTKENDVYKRERKVQFTNEETITFKLPEPKIFEKAGYDWYIIVALEKSDLVKFDRHLLTYDLFMQYRWAIREGFNHHLDGTLRNPYDRPNNRNTVKGILMYIERITALSKNEFNLT